MGIPLCRLPSASDANAAREEEMLVGRTLSVPWIRGESWAGTPEELEEAWAAEVSRGCAPLAHSQHPVRRPTRLNQLVMHF